MPISLSLEECFRLARLAGQGTLIVYLTLGDPSWEDTLRLVRLLTGAGTGIAGTGADIIELGWPSRNPYMDGPIIIESHHRARMALAQAAGLAGDTGKDGEARQFSDAVWTLLAQIRSCTDRPLVLMGYREDLLAYPGDLVQRCISTGINAVLIPDASEEDLQGLDGLKAIRLFDSLMDESQVRNAAARAEGFAYVRTHTGLTGNHAEICPEVMKAISCRIRRVRPDLPLAMGFGLKGPKDVAEVMQLGFEGAIVGTAVVEFVSRQDWTGLVRFVAGLRAATAKPREG